MAQTSKFRGIGGDVIVGLISLGTIFSALGVMIVLLVSNAILAIALREGATSFSLILGTFLVSRFAIPASRGNFASGLLSTEIRSGETLKFLMIYFGVTLCWLLPWLGIAFLTWELSEQSTQYDASSLSNSLSPAFDLLLGFRGMATAFLLSIVALAPGITTIITTAFVAERVSDIHELKEWMKTRKEDLLVFYSSAIGGVVVFICTIVFPLLLIAALCLKHDGSIAAIIGGISWALPFGASTVLFGRLAGAFVYADDGSSGAVPKALNTESGIAISAGTFPYVASKATKPLENDDVSIQAQLGIIRELSSSNVGEAIDLCEGLKQKHRQNAFVSVALIKLYVEARCSDKAVSELDRVLSLRIPLECESYIVDFFGALSESQRDGIVFSSNSVLKLEELAMRHGEFRHAWWCVVTRQRKFKLDDHSAQRRFFEIAEAASAKRMHQLALEFYDEFLRMYPESTFADYARKALQNERELLRGMTNDSEKRL